MQLYVIMLLTVMSFPPLSLLCVCQSSSVIYKFSISERYLAFLRPQSLIQSLTLPLILQIMNEWLKNTLFFNPKGKFIWLAHLIIHFACYYLPWCMSGRSTWTTPFCFFAFTWQPCATKTHQSHRSFVKKTKSRASPLIWTYVPVNLC